MHDPLDNKSELNHPERIFEPSDLNDADEYLRAEKEYDSKPKSKRPLRYKIVGKLSYFYPGLYAWQIIDLVNNITDNRRDNNKRK